MNQVKLTENVYWVGAIEWNLRNFHGYLTRQGTTYNAYLIIDEKITLIDTVKSNFSAEMIRNISAIIDPAKIDYIVVNHVEMDHSGALPDILKIAKNATIITSPHGEKGINQHFENSWNIKTVNDNETVNIGKKNLSFLLTPMVHWPDNMLTYLNEDQILFSNDAFGQHLASSQRFDDEYPLDIIVNEAKKYFANIVLPYDKAVNAALNKAKQVKEFSIIAPSHGLIWKKNIYKILDLYEYWCNQKVEEKAVIVYDTMWDSTHKIAKELEFFFKSNHIHVDLYNLQFNHISDIMISLVNAQYLCIGSPTLNNFVLPSVSAFLTYIQGLKPKNKIGLAFGSYGWGGQSVSQIDTVLKELCEKCITPLKVQYQPDINKLKKEINHNFKGVLS